jgi:uncharacterized protein YjdB
LKILALVVVVSVALVACGGGAKSMELSPQSAKLDQKGATATLAVTFKDANGKVVEAKKQVTWTSSDDKVATVANGVVTAVDSGAATITATAGELTATAKVTVQIPKAIVITPTELQLNVGDKKALTAKVVDTAGKEIMGKPIDWKTEKPAVATVVGGKVIGNGEGATSVTASWGSLSASATVIVGKGKEEVKEPKGVGKKEIEKPKGVGKKEEKKEKKDKKDEKKDKKKGK